MSGSGVPPGKKRIFVALPIDDAARPKFSQVSDALKPHFEEMKWVPAENLHVTLHFIGEVPGADIEVIRAACDGAEELAAPVLAEFSELCFFGTKNAPRVLFARCKGGDADSHFEPLAAALRERLARWSKPEDRPFKMHLTLGRFRNMRPGDLPSARNERSLGRLASAPEPPFVFEPIRVEITRMVLFESVFADRSVSYRVICEWPFAGS